MFSCGLQTLCFRPYIFVELLDGLLLGYVGPRVRRTREELVADLAVPIGPDLLGETVAVVNDVIRVATGLPLGCRGDGRCFQAPQRSNAASSPFGCPSYFLEIAAITRDTPRKFV